MKGIFFKQMFPIKKNVLKIIILTRRRVQTMILDLSTVKYKRFVKELYSVISLYIIMKSHILLQILYKILFFALRMILDHEILFQNSLLQFVIIQKITEITSLIK